VEATLQRDDVLHAIGAMLPTIGRLRDDVRLVGTASSLLRGIELPVGDVDILARRREVVDELTAQARAVEAQCVASPGWIENPFFGQYFAEFDVAGTRVSFSTVEAHAAHPVAIAECIGDAPWAHFDIVDIGGPWVPLVASELRLLSEVERGRQDRWRPIGSHLAHHGFDHTLLAAAAESLPPELASVMRDAVRITAA
jgi:hypothetical protein